MNKIPSRVLFAVAQQVPADPQVETPASVESTPSVTPENNAPIKERTEVAAKRAFKGYQCWAKFREQIRKVVAWIKAIPSHIRSIPNEIAKALNHLISSKEDDALEDTFADDDESLQEISLQTPPPKSEVNEEDILKFKQNLNREYLREFYKTWNVNANQFANNVSLIKIKYISDLETIKNYTSYINVNIAKINKFISVLAEAEVSDEIKEYANAQLTILSEKFTATQKDLQTRVAAKQKKIRDLENAERNKDKAPPVLKTKVPQAFIDDARNRNTAHALDLPPDFTWSANSCWYDTALTMFWNMGDLFHTLVEEKWLQRDQVNEAYNRDLERYNGRKQAWDQSMVKYNIDFKKAQTCQKAYDDYKKDIEKIDKQEKKALEEFDQKSNLFRSQGNEYLARKSAWEENGKKGEAPIPPEEPKRPPVLERPEEPTLFRAPIKPPKPSPPFNYPELLDALRQYSLAVKIGRNIHTAAANLRRVVEKDGLLFTHGRQEDVHEFFNTAISFLRESNGQPNSLFQIEVQARGKEGTAFEGLSRKELQDHNILELDFKGNTTNFQELLDANFIEEDSDPEESEPLYNMQEDPQCENSIQANLVVKKQRILNPENPPDFFLVHMKRFYYPTGRQMARERTTVLNQRKELIQKRAEELLAKDANTYKTSSQKVAEDQLKREKKLPELPVYDGGIRKNETKLRFPENHRISFAKLYEKDARDPNYEYELCGTAIHYGAFGFGHYVANVKSSDQSKWCFVNDQDTVKIVSLNEALQNNSNIYVGLFRRVKRNIPQSG